tara:strand:+ start:462 stop:710 length:249 start_codon:yes stop_codon:yes gene_type:complete
MVIIYGRPACGWCDQAIAICKQYKIEYEYKNIRNENFKEELFEKLPSAKTVPQIWWNDKHIGGFSELAEEIDNTRGGVENGF